MAIAAADESVHTPPAGAPLTWQENCFLMGWDDGAGAGFYLHVERLPGRDVQEIKAMVVTADHGLVAAVDQAPLGEDFTGVHVVEPYRKLDLRFAGYGRWSADGATTLAGESGGDMPVGFELDLEAVSEPVDWAPLLERMAVEGTERNHYEQGFRWTGTLRLGSQSLVAGGLALRDHTWGARSYDGFSVAWWTPMCLSDGTYVTGVCLQVDDDLVGGALSAPPLGEGAAQAYASGAHRVDVEGAPLPGRYPGATVTAGGRTLRADVFAHLPVPYPGFGLPFITSEGWSRITTDDGRTGFGTVEWNGPMATSGLDGARV